MACLFLLLSFLELLEWLDFLNKKLKCKMQRELPKLPYLFLDFCLALFFLTLFLLTTFSLFQGVSTAFLSFV